MATPAARAAVAVRFSDSLAPAGRVLLIGRCGPRLASPGVAEVTVVPPWGPDRKLDGLASWLSSAPTLSEALDDIGDRRPEAAGPPGGHWTQMTFCTVDGPWEE